MQEPVIVHENGTISIYNGLLLDKNISNHEYVFLVRLYIENFPNEQIFAEKINKSVTTVRKYLKTLLEKGYLNKEQYNRVRNGGKA